MIINAQNLNLRQISDPLARQIVILLLTDAFAEADELPANVTRRGGCWHNTIEFNIANRKQKINLGSKLWLLQEQPLTDASLPLAEQYAREALQILVDSGHIAELKVTATRAQERLSLLINYNGKLLTLEGL